MHDPRIMERAFGEFRCHFKSKSRDRRCPNQHCVKKEEAPIIPIGGGALLWCHLPVDLLIFIVRIPPKLLYAEAAAFFETHSYLI